MTANHTVVEIDLTVRFPTSNPHPDNFTAFVFVDDEPQVQVRRCKKAPIWRCAACGDSFNLPKCLHTIAARAAIVNHHSREEKSA